MARDAVANESDYDQEIAGSNPGVTRLFSILILPKFSVKFWRKRLLLLGKTNHVSILGRN